MEEILKKKGYNVRKLKGNFLEQAIRVNHAGEYGAVCIYSGQKFILKGSSIISKIIEMEEQEKKHFRYFSEKIKEQKIRPTILLPIWHVLGVSLGVVTAIMGKKAAMACTAAVEEVIEEHYKEQVLHLENGELKETISKFRDEELEHRDIAIEYNAKNAFCYNVLSLFIKTSCKAAIYLSKLI
ncbi:demethoxyubiquinone hydroxylase family protein [Wolbachia endosymbiont of Dirofilaria (Dirofilaria) immitis]|uniref:demethoxyubiquinone hydroxylase family protein n=1 Tax=Wolbachia endosymbiont of Dirofilaria (Dirofilaria) immitis TaxID=1812115 RepID=UPI00158975C5|nr:demethoxyubiquinone hydroxylase family protein [Wolbachia endosymbiont of Dirofilaria (Dirofilaria) immitis]QKX02129.1 demethoxyubiquinone hydroxylase family protein [Wolbachia endosymbiont of Dirofilaria (Dirofilaria) immitis]